MATDDQKEICNCLYRLDGKSSTQLLELDGKNVATLGRHENNDYVLADSPAVSRWHVRLEKNKEGWLISDAGSSNGIWINGRRQKRATKHLLQNKDIVEIAKDPNSDDPGAYRYQFYKKAKLVHKQNDEKHKDQPVNISEPSMAELQQKMKEQELRLQAELDAKASEKAHLEQCIKQQQALEKAMEDLRSQLDAKEAIRQKLEETVKEERAVIQAKIEEQRLQQLEAEQSRERLQKEMEQKLKEKDLKYAEEIQTKINSFSSDLQTMENEKKNLHVQLGCLKSEVEKEKQKQSEAMENVVSKVEGVMEEELICAICAELLVQATSLSCAHSFCNYCITKWMQKKKECPNCRKTIMSTVRSIVLDNYINKIVTFLSKDLQDQRKEVLNERKVEQQRLDAEIAASKKVLENTGNRAETVPTVIPVTRPTVQTSQVMNNLLPVLQLFGNNPPGSNQTTYIIPVTGANQVRQPAGLLPVTRSLLHPQPAATRTTNVPSMVAAHTRRQATVAQTNSAATWRQHPGARDHGRQQRR